MENNLITLPDPELGSNTSIEKALFNRRSIRRYLDKAISLSEISQILWSAQGTTTGDGKRTAPSAGATYPLEIYLNASNVASLSRGIYSYDSTRHTLHKLFQQEQKSAIASAALDQSFIMQAAAIIIITAIFERTTNSYGKRGIQYVQQEAGAVAQNIHLQAVSLNIGTVMVGAFRDDQVKRLLLPHLRNFNNDFSVNEEPLLLMPLGKIK
jgi:SagB-type dehydrogenase family enzyme